MNDASGPPGTNVALSRSAATEKLPEIGTPVTDGYTWNVDAFTVSGLIGSLNASRTTTFVGTPAAPLAGATRETLGPAASVAVPVVKVADATAVTRLPPMSVESGELAGYIEDQQGLFNLNNLVRDGKVNLAQLAHFQRLLSTLGLHTVLANTLVDWIDADSEPRNRATEVAASCPRN